MGLAKDCWFSKDLRPKAVDFSQFEQLLKSTIQKHKPRQKHSHLVSQWPNSNIKIPVLMADSPGHAMHVGDWSLSFKYPTSGTRESPKMQRDRSFVCNAHRTCRTCSICKVPSKFYFWLGYFTLAWPMQSTAKTRLDWKLLDGQPWLESGDKPKTLSQLKPEDMKGRHGIPGTISKNVAILEHLPQDAISCSDAWGLVRSIQRHCWSFIGTHGSGLRVKMFVFTPRASAIQLM